MNIYIDESGSFVNAPVMGKWNAVAALAVPETERKKLEHLVHRLKTLTIGASKREVKLNEITEDAYINFIADLARLNVAVFCTATDAGLNTTCKVACPRTSMPWSYPIIVIRDTRPAQCGARRQASAAAWSWQIVNFDKTAWL